jgi:glycosyltransferase involved in cell wall biosynthesis
MRFCMITTFYPPYSFGGDGVFVQRLSHELARQGHTVEVVHCVDSYHLLAGGRPAPEIDPPPGVKVHRLHSRYGPLAPILTHQTGRPLLHAPRLREILAQGFDVINYHNISLIGGPGILEMGSAFKLYTLHEYWLVCPTHVLYKDKREACVRPRCLCCTLRYGRPPQYWRHTGMLSRATEQIDCFIAASRFAEEQHERMGLKLRAVVLPHFAPWADEPSHPRAGDSPVGTSPGVRSAPDEAEARRVGANEGFFLFVGRLEKLKGLQTILPILRRRPDLRLVVAGAGTYERELHRQARDCPNVRFLGAVRGDALRRLYAEAVALVVPSLTYEIGPLVVLEAFSQGTPVVARRIGAIPEIVEAGVRGETFTSPEEAEAAMDRLQSDRAYRDRLGDHCRESCRREFSLQNYVERYLRIISTAGPGAASRLGSTEATGAPADPGAASRLGSAEATGAPADPRAAAGPEAR